MQLPAFDDRVLEVRLGERRWGDLGACVLKAPHFLFLLFAILFYFMNIMTFTE